MPASWRDRAAHLRRLWRMPNALQSDLAAAAAGLEAVRAETAALRATLEDFRAEQHATAALRTVLEDLRAEQRALAEQRQIEGYRTIEGAAAATLQLLGPRLDALARQVEALPTAAGAPPAAVEEIVARRVEALVQPRHADLRELAMRSIHRGEEAGGLGRALSGAVAELRGRLDGSQDAASRRLQRLEDLAFDVLALARTAGGTGPAGPAAPRLSLRTDHPVAAGSADHLHPRGTAQDDTRHPRFVAACERRFPGRPIRHLDLGCAGGGLVWDFLQAGHASCGIEGSDYSQRTRRAYWRVVPERLFTADITERFALADAAGTPQAFDVVTAWEVLEHIPEGALDGLLGNVARCLAPGGLFAASVATFPDEDAATGAVWHVTIRPREWWLERAAAHGLRPAADGGGFETADFPRGSGNPRMPDWDARRDPSLGFHLVLER